MRVRVLVTRPAPAASRTASALEAMGFDAVVVPLTHTRPMAVETWPEAKAIDAVAITSVNAVRHAPPRMVAALAEKPCYAVGERSREAAVKAGFSNVLAGQGDAAALARIIADQCREAHLVYLCGRVRHPGFEAMLSGSTVSVVPVEVYDTVELSPDDEAVARLVDAGGLDAVMVYSVNAARSLTRLSARPDLAHVFNHARFLCLSSRIADALRAGGLKTIETSTRPCEKAMLALLSRN